MTKVYDALTPNSFMNRLHTSQLVCLPRYWRMLFTYSNRISLCHVLSVDSLFHCYF